MIPARFAVSFIGLVGDVRGDQRVVEHFVQSQACRLGGILGMLLFAASSSSLANDAFTGLIGW